MLNQETKRRIDSARDILVGKVPDPKAQVEQITTALIYKFMDDMDKESEELGGKARFFVNEYEKYSWSKLLDSRLGGFERLNLYVEALLKMPQNANLPQLFRNILKDAFLPYRDPETLNLFLKEINGFTYEHSEKLGDAYEYLLSVLGSQGDAGQFRTPRHIIDFIVEVVDPKKDETILDPACGTAGFLISAYKHILKQNTIHKLGDQLTPEDKTRLMNHFMGYDISPDMVKLSLVNMYLHSFPNPNVFEYDTLTNEERWDETYDVIMANPPFMSPKGGIRPHKRFSIQANRSEVLFVDYIAEHITTHGRAGVIVPEGIIFQSGNAYKALRKMLIEKYLFAVVSLPAGVFQPYSGVKTCILLMDKQLAKKAGSILFVKVENDGFDLGAQRRAIEKNDLTEALCILQKYKQALNENTNVKDMFLEEEASLAVVAEKEKIAKNGDYNLTGERYRESLVQLHQKWPMVELGEVCETSSGGTPLKSRNEYFENGTIPWLKSGEVAQGFIYQSEEKITEAGLKNSSAKIFPVNTVLVAMYGATAGQVGLLKFEATTNQAICGILPNSKFIPEFLYWILKSQRDYMVALSGGGAQPNISQNIIRKIKIPLPPLDVQQEIVAELENYQKVIDGARQVVESYRPQIKIDATWELYELGKIARNLDSRRKPVTKSDRTSGKFPYYGASGIVDYVDDYLFDEDILLVSEDGANLIARNTPIAFSITGKTWVNNHAHVLKFANMETQKFVETYLNSLNLEYYITGSAQPKLNQESLNSIKIPLPPLSIQRQIIAQIEQEQKRVQVTKELVEIFEQKIKDKIAEVWGE
jgi:type I restriction enzyme M protein